MKLYLLDTLESGVYGIYKSKEKNEYPDENINKCAQFNELIKNWETLSFTICDKINNGKKFYDAISHNRGYYIVNKNTKEIIEKEYGELVQFLPMNCCEKLNENFYLLYPIYSLDVLDVDKSECSFIEDSRVFTAIYKYVFAKNRKYLAIFKLKSGDFIYSRHVIVTDTFRDFIESNNITGFDFEEVFDFDKE